MKEATTHCGLVDELIGMTLIRDAPDLDSIPASSTLRKAFDRLKIAIRRIPLNVSSANVPLNGVTGIDITGYFISTGDNMTDPAVGFGRSGLLGSEVLVMYGPS